MENQIKSNLIPSSSELINQSDSHNLNKSTKFFYKRKFGELDSNCAINNGLTNNKRIKINSQSMIEVNNQVSSLCINENNTNKSDLNELHINNNLINNLSINDAINSQTSTIESNFTDKLNRVETTNTDTERQMIEKYYKVMNDKLHKLIFE